MAQLNALAEKLKKQPRFTIDMEATAQDDMDALPVGISIALPTEGLQVEEASYIPVGHVAPATEGEPVDPGPS